MICYCICEVTGQVLGSGYRIAMYIRVNIHFTITEVYGDGILFIENHNCFESAFNSTVLRMPVVTEGDHVLVK